MNLRHKSYPDQPQPFCTSLPPTCNVYSQYKGITYNQQSYFVGESHNLTRSSVKKHVILYNVVFSICLVVDKIIISAKQDTIEIQLNCHTLKIKLASKSQYFHQYLTIRMEKCGSKLSNQMNQFFTAETIYTRIQYGSTNI